MVILILLKKGEEMLGTDIYILVGVVFYLPYIFGGVYITGIVFGIWIQNRSKTKSIKLIVAFSAFAFLLFFLTLFLPIAITPMQIYWFLPFVVFPSFISAVLFLTGSLITRQWQKKGDNPPKEESATQTKRRLFITHAQKMKTRDTIIGLTPFLAIHLIYLLLYYLFLDKIPFMQPKEFFMFRFYPNLLCYSLLMLVCGGFAQYKISRRISKICLLSTFSAIVSLLTFIIQAVWDISNTFVMSPVSMLILKHAVIFVLCCFFAFSVGQLFVSGISSRRGHRHSSDKSEKGFLM